MKKYIIPENLSEALEALEKYSDGAKLISGGTDLLIQIRDGKTKPKYLIDLANLRELNYITTKDNSIKIGALATHNDVATSGLIVEKAPLLVEACSSIGAPQVRNMGTPVGNIMNASPAADSTIALLALDAEAKIVNKGNERIQKIESIFAGPGKTNLKPNEMVTELQFKELGANQGGGFIKLGKRRSLAISIINAAVVIKVDKEKKIFTDARIAIGAVAPTPLRVKGAEAMLVGHSINDETIENAASKAKKEVAPIDDIRGSASYRSEMAYMLVRQAIKKALEGIK